MVSKCWHGTRGEHTGKMQTRENIKLFTLLHICKVIETFAISMPSCHHKKFIYFVGYYILQLHDYVYQKVGQSNLFFLNSTMIIHFFFIYVRYVDALYNKISILMHLLKLIFHHLLFNILFSCIVKSWKLCNFLQDLHFLLRV